MQAIDATLKSMIETSVDLEQLCHVVYCAAITANKIQQITPKTVRPSNKQNNKPPWEKRLEDKIKELRKEIGTLTAYLREQTPSKRLEKKTRAYSKKAKLKKTASNYRTSLKSHSEKLKQKVAAMGNRLRRYHKRTLRHRQNNMFSKNQREFYRSLGEPAEGAEPPSSDSMQGYWSQVWSQSSKHNDSAPWIRAEKENLRTLPEMQTVCVTEENVRETVRRMKNWSSPGIDGIHNYWWRSLPSTHGTLSRLIQRALENPSIIPP